MNAERLSTTCCIAGGGPAGIMLGLLLARAGIPVIVLEKHLDFFRDFRGDTIHPSTVDLVDQLGLRERFDAIQHSALRTLDIVVDGHRLRPVDLGHLRGHNREIVLMPQWDFLKLLAEEGERLPGFRLIMGAEVTGLLRDSDGDGGGEGERVTGVTATTAEGELEIEARLTVGADGRASAVRAASGLPSREYGVPVDVLWFRLPRPEDNPPDTLGYLTEKTMVITIPRHDYYQAAMLIPKDGFEAVRARGLGDFRATIAGAARFLGPVVDTLTGWEQVKLLSVQVNRLDRWHLPGLLCIGDAAHAMSPAFGVGINYAIQDAVATANLLTGPLLAGTLTERDLARVQRRRLRPVRLMQAIQIRLHALIAKPDAGALLPTPLPWPTRLALAVAFPVLRLVTARVIGRGFRPERIRPT
jgi:2-polyprenyl-6-methoxyphenol hydroxylase-like FAD-dependent oxidoreductase